MKTLLALILATLCMCGIRAATYNASSTSRADVLSAYNLTSAGSYDTVVIPAGTSTWSAGISISHDVRIVGAGTNSTKLINSQIGDPAPIWSIDLASDGRVEISDMTLEDENLDRNCTGIHTGGNTVHETQLVFHGINFDSFGKSLYIGGSFGVAYNCGFYNTLKQLRMTGYYSSAQLAGYTAPPWDWGSTNYFVLEDCYYFWTNQTVGINYISTEKPANYMVRYCTYQVDKDTSDGSDAWEQHGEVSGSGALYPLGFTCYKNTFIYTGTDMNDVRVIDVRGGQGTLIYSNTISGAGWYGTMRNNGNTGGDSTMMTNTYVWANDGLTLGESDGVTLGTHYFTNAPGGLIELAYPHPLRSLDFGETSSAGKGRGVRGSQGRGRFR